MREHRYSVITTIPTSAEDQILFWDFKMKEILNQMNLLIVVTIFFWIMCFIDAISFRNVQHGHNFIFDTLQSLQIIGIWLISKRFKTGFIYFFPVIFILTKIVELIGITSWSSFESLNIEDWGFHKHIQLQLETHIW